MKAVVISDIHGSGYYAEKIKEINERENPDKIILLGDLYYHGPRNELSQEYKPMKVAEILNSLKDKLLSLINVFNFSTIIINYYKGYFL